MNLPPTLLRRATSFLVAGTTGWTQIWVRLAVGLIFFTQGILKYTDPNLGVVRFARIGFPHPGFTAHFVGTFEIACGFVVLIGLGTRLASLPLLIVILTAIATTKLPELNRAGQDAGDSGAGRLGGMAWSGYRRRSAALAAPPCRG